MNPAQLRVHVEAYLRLRRARGFQTQFETYHWRELLGYVEGQGFSWPIRTQTIMDWISAASVHCGLPGQRMRLIHARCFLRHLTASVPETGLLASTGLRAGEVLALTVDDVRLDSDPPQLHIRNTKFYKSRIVPIHSRTADRLRAYCSGVKSVFGSVAMRSVP